MLTITNVYFIVIFLVFYLIEEQIFTLFAMGAHSPSLLIYGIQL